jgi:hypothetical protein
MIGNLCAANFQSLEIQTAAMFRGMSFIADTHVHLYPFYDLAAALRGAMSRLAALAPGLPRVLCLTERRDGHFFRDAISGAVKMPPPFSVFPAGKNSLVVIDNAGEKLFVVAGRQLATSERLEVHCIGIDADIPDGLPLRDAIEHVLVAGGVPVIPWGVGKWLGRRGLLVSEALNQSSETFAGDSSLRPWCWPEKDFVALPARVLFGSDPLPAPGEENQIAGYATIFDAPFDEADPAASVTAALRNGAPMRRAGKRGGPLAVWKRLQAMKKARP